MYLCKRERNVFVIENQTTVFSWISHEFKMKSCIETEYCLTFKKCFYFSAKGLLEKASGFNILFL